MFVTREARLPAKPSTRARPTFGAVALVVFIVTAAMLALLATQIGSDSREHAAAVQASLTQHVDDLAYISGPDGGEFSQPADAVVLHGQRFVLDTGNDRILAVDESGLVSGIVKPTANNLPVLNAPMAMATDGESLFVANTGDGTVLVLEPDGTLTKVIDLPQAADPAPRPTGLAVDRAGNLAVADSAGNRVFRYDGSGALTQVLGRGSRAGGTEGFNAPAGMTFDGAGYLYVVDVLNGRVVKIAPDGTFAGEFGRPGNTAGTLSRPKDVAIDRAENVYVSDALLAAVQVFNEHGGYIGFIGRAEPDDPGSRSVFTAPAGMTVSGDSLYVVDRFEGLLVFDVSSPISPE